MANSAFRQQLEDAVRSGHSAMHPWSEAWVGGKLNRHMLGEWVKQHYHYVGYFAQWLGMVYANCPQREVQDFLLENIAEEEGLVGQAGMKAVRHADLLLDFAVACGKSRQEIVDAQLNGQLNPETLGLQSWCHRQANGPWVTGIAALLVGLESQVPGIYQRTTPPLIEKYGFTEEEVTFFSIHIVADVEHGEKGYQMVERFADTPELQAACVRTVKEATGMRRLYLDGVYNRFLAKQVPVAA